MPATISVQCAWQVSIRPEIATPGIRLLTDVPGPASVAVMQERGEVVPPGYPTATSVLARTWRDGYLVDIDGNRLVDLTSGIGVSAFGGTHPVIARAVQRQADKLLHTAFSHVAHRGYVDVCRELNALPAGAGAYRSVLFTTGAEAVENAVKIARAATGRPGIAVLGASYHGRTLLTLSMTAKQVPYKDGFGPFLPDVQRLPMPTVAADFGGYLDRHLREPESIGCLVVEPIQGEGGVVVPPRGFLRALAEQAARHGIVVIADEIQTGLGRTGTVFAHEQEGFEPDLITVGKALGAGLPLSAVVGRTELMDRVPVGGFGGTFAGNPLSCAAALASLRLMRELDLPARARAIGDVFRSRLGPVAARRPKEVALRGRGALWGLVFHDPVSGEPDRARAVRVGRDCLAAGVLVLVGGLDGNVVRMLPPLVSPPSVIHEGLAILADVA